MALREQNHPRRLSPLHETFLLSIWKKGVCKDGMNGSLIVMIPLDLKPITKRVTRNFPMSRLAKSSDGLPITPLSPYSTFRPLRLDWLRVSISSAG